MNKGLDIWAKKRAKRSSQAMGKKPEQTGIVQFVLFKDTVHHKVNGKFAHPYIVKRQGLQIENRFYFIDCDKVRYCMVNKHGAKVLNRFNGIPNWASAELITKYNEMREKLSIKNNLEAVNDSIPSKETKES